MMAVPEGSSVEKGRVKEVWLGGRTTGGITSELFEERE